MKLATFRTEGGERIGVVHAGDTKLFDLAAVAGRTGTANPAFASMLSLIDAGEGGLDAARALVERYGNDESLSRDV
ncbi:MAG: fumarylacetoacetate hydrolase family protein, partial [Bradyrhizobium sp.]|nr:fumarylacetoacetate hydrolase family protein [Bradyrhizobium sp.]